MSGIKYCPRCGRELPATAFNRSSANKDGLQALCRDCSKKANLAWRRKWKEKKDNFKMY